MAHDRNSPYGLGSREAPRASRTDARASGANDARVINSSPSRSSTARSPSPAPAAPRIAASGRSGSARNPSGNRSPLPQYRTHPGKRGRVPDTPIMNASEFPSSPSGAAATLLARGQAPRKWRDRPTRRVSRARTGWPSQGACSRADHAPAARVPGRSRLRPGPARRACPERSCVSSGMPVAPPRNGTSKTGRCSPRRYQKPSCSVNSSTSGNDRIRSANSSGSRPPSAGQQIQARSPASATRISPFPRRSARPSRAPAGRLAQRIVFPG